MKLSEIKTAMTYFPSAEKRQAARQAIRLIQAKIYLHQNDIYAIKIGTKFQYNRSTGSVL